MINAKTLRDITHKGVPPHKLTLKVGDVCLVTRNINIESGLTNNTRVRIIKFENNCIKVQTLTDTPQIFFLPRINFKFRMNYGQSYEVIRKQFPLRRAFALTFNKSQGQTLKKVLLDVRKSVFSHGFLYVGLSRVTDCKNIAMFINEEGQWYSLYDQRLLATTINIVYPEIFDI